MKWRRLGLWGLAIWGFLVVGIIGALELAAPLHMTQIDVVDALTTPSEELIDFTRDFFGSMNPARLMVFERRFKTAAQKRWPQIRALFISISPAVPLTEPFRLEIRIKEREALVDWCRAVKCYLVDADGVAFRQTTLEAGALTPLVLEETSAKPFHAGSSLRDDPAFQTVSAILTAARRRDIPIAVIAMREASPDVRALTQGDWMIILDPAALIVDQFDTLAAILKRLGDQVKQKKLDYIDVRVKNKGYVKWLQSD